MSPFQEPHPGPQEGLRESDTMTARNRRTPAIRLVLIVLGLVLVAGYTVGKDMALRDNARDAATREPAGNR